MRYRTALATLLLGVAAGCAATAYDRYRVAHPAWTATLVPPRGAALDEVIGTLRNPALVTGRIEIVDATGSVWTRLDAAALEAGSAPPNAARLLVASSSSCVQTPGDVIRYRAFHWHLLVEGRLVAAEQTLFDGRCFEHVERVGPELPPDDAACFRRFASAQVRGAPATAPGCTLPQGSTRVRRKSTPYGFHVETFQTSSTPPSPSGPV